MNYFFEVLIMKQMIVLLSTVILGIAIAAMILSFKDTSQGLADSTKAKIENALGLEGPAAVYDKQR